MELVGVEAPLLNGFCPNGFCPNGFCPRLPAALAEANGLAAGFCGWPKTDADELAELLALPKTDIELFDEPPKTEADVLPKVDLVVGVVELKAGGLPKRPVDPWA